MAHAGAGVALADGDAFGPLTAIATPGHAPDHLAFVAGGACFTGDAVLGEGSVFVAPDPGALTRLPRRPAAAARARRSTSSAPATGRRSPTRRPSSTPTSRTASTASAGSSPRSTTGCARSTRCSTASGPTCPPALRPAAAVTLAAHLDKLAEEGRLPAGVERPALGR